ncbi:MAG: tetratricopeptide repeat protein, partial [Actinomycetota bacterium]|nr:tetratricopeptide repeat protein [Actinomycetota bacterium]
MARKTVVFVMANARTRGAHPRRGDAGGRLLALRREEAPGRLPSNLPHRISSFVGRERELAELKGLLNETRLLTLTGPGGCGKTRLALETAEGLAEGFGDGTWLVELASLSEPDLVPQAVASALGVREVPDRSLTELLVDHLKPRKMLLVLDNCEHLIEACAALAGTLLRACQGLRILATSREALGIVGERLWLVPPLSFPEQTEHPAPGDLMRFDAIKLFIERATAVAPAFELTEGNTQAVLRVCRRLDGMPLGVELAAARTKVLTVEQIDAHLDDRFRLLAVGDRTAAPRQRTLRAAIDWSFGLLSTEERRLFRRLSVFSGVFSLWAAEDVCSGNGVEEEGVLEILSHLVDKSLVLVAGQRAGEARYRMLETVSQYASEKLEQSGEDAEVRRRHAGFFLRLACRAEPELVGPEQASWLALLEAHHDDLRAALGWLAGEGRVEEGLELGEALWRFWWLGGYLDEGRAHLSGLLSLTEEHARTSRRARALHVLGLLCSRHADYAGGDQAEARRYQEEALSIYRQLKDERRTAAALRELGRISAESGDGAKARPLLDEALILERGSGNKHGVALTLTFLGCVEHLEGESTAAHPLLEEALALFEDLEDRFYVGINLFLLGRAATDEGDFAEARARFAGLLETLPPSRYRWFAPRALEALARLAAAQGRPTRALTLAGAAE